MEYLCPKCGTKTRVTKTCNDFSDHVRRYRRCPACGHTFATKQPFAQLFEEQRERTYQVYKKEDILKMRRIWLEEGKSSREVAEIFGCSVSWVNKVVKRKAWADL